ncbi:hypothetical protein PGTUg99_023983 [Puccinia graminis f. sp. tritici]|uniref:Uncharacterized protein n=2 Tax=Puccinia graminis f. sp. tritici TaxID=56615 RepID=A0A5B0PIG4_PUCGR|nr:hypothetical protein PGTUg99_023983 [Puccinia graminis f. sp. tritici]
MRPDKYFFEEETDRFSCILCGGKSTTNQKKHARGERHQNLVRLDKERLQRQQERIAANEALNQDESNRPRVEIETITNTDLQNEQLQPLSAQNDDESDVVPINLFEDGESEHEEEEMDWLNLLGVAIDQIDDEPADSFEEHPVPAYQRDVVEIEEITTIDSPWFPFVNKEYLIGSLLVGYLHKLISRDLYHQIRSILTLCQTNLPGWDALRSTRKKIRLMSHHSLVEKESAFGKPMFALDLREIISDDLRNPLVVPHLDFLPEDTHGRDIFKTSQSAKWLKHLEPDLRVQMVAYNEKHYYTYEPVQLKNDEIVIPIFFHTFQSNTFAKCYKPQLKSNRIKSMVKITIASNILYDDPNLQEIPLEDFDLLYPEILSSDEQDSEATITLPNPWREKANGKIIRHVPLNMYCDDTSGNKSKKWNKHISYYFTLSGLPPKISNQQFNCHFLCTSNIAGALDLGEIVVQQLNEMVNNGFEAYDMTLSQTVLVMAPLLCFMADSPMHAEITNTPVPGPSLNPCRQPNNFRTTEKTIRDSEALWKYVKENAQTMNKEKLDEKSVELGIRDQTNRKFSKRIIAFRATKKALLQDGKELPPEMDQPIPQDLCIESGLNCQHNCDRGNCTITPTEVVIVERRKSSVMRPQVKHNDDDNYVINSASLSAQVSYRKISSLNFKAIPPLDWIDALHDGLNNWGSSVEKKQTRKRKRATTASASGTQFDPSLN